MKDVTELREQCRELLKKKKAPGPWWKNEVLEREARGLPVSVTAHELATTNRLLKVDQGEY